MRFWRLDWQLESVLFGLNESRAQAEAGNGPVPCLAPSVGTAALVAWVRTISRCSHADKKSIPLKMRFLESLCVERAPYKLLLTSELSCLLSHVNSAVKTY